MHQPSHITPPPPDHASHDSHPSYRLAAYLKSAGTIPYRPGTHDCVLFVARWVDTCTGSNFATEIAASYQTKFQGLARLAPAGVCKAVHQRLTAAGWKPTSTPRDGDICLTDLDHPGIWHFGAIRCQPLGAVGALILVRKHLTLALTHPSVSCPQ